MSNPYLEMDPALLAEFIDESSDMLASVDALFVQLETNPTDLDVVNAIFRPVHSIKGNSAFFGFNKVKALAHEMESLLDKVRKRTLTVSKPMMDVLLEGVDALKIIFTRARNGESEVQDEAAFQELVNRVKQAATGSPDPIQVIRSTMSALEQIKKAHDPVASEIEAILRELTAITGPVGEASAHAATTTTTNQSMNPIQALAELLRQPITASVALELQEKTSELLREISLQAASDKARSLIADARDAFDTFIATVGFDDLLRDILLDKVAAMQEEPGWQTKAEPSPADGAAPQMDAPPEKAAAPAKNDAQKTMRISESHIDTFLAYVGELIVVGDMFRHLQNKIAAMDNASEVVGAFRHTSSTFDTLSSNLQTSIMSIRKLPVRSLLQKTHRLVRDIAAKKGKEIAVELFGEEVEVDKSLTDLLDAPLTHMVRNAADHGIEMPDARKAAGKSPKGLIRVGVSEEEAEIVLSIEDDGAGLNLDAIQVKAESMGLIKPGQQLRQSDIVAMIFSAGVSTAREVSDVSGRGVGMDVVKSAIEGNGGAITVQTERGKGSVFRVSLPKSVTTQIISGFLVEVDTQCYVLHMSRVRETISASASDIHSINNAGLCLKRHGEIMPMVALRGILGLPEKDPFRNESRILVAIEAHKRFFALEVDALLGVQQVVLRDIQGIENQSAMIAGGALMGDGSVALVLDTDYIFDRRRKPETHG